MNPLTPIEPPLFRGLKRFLPVLVIALAGLFPRLYTWEQTFVDGLVLYADADCYARMTRVREFMEGGWRPVTHHDFENWPIGTDPHTTLPFDVAIALLAVVLGPFLGTPPLEALPLAGAWIGPVLAFLGMIGLGMAWPRSLRGRWQTLLLFALSPPIVWANVVGRPDHQALLVPLLALAAVLTLDLFRRGGTPRRAVFGGLAWGLPLRTSLFEPLILLVVTAGAWFFVRRGRANHRVLLLGAIALPLALMLLLEGLRITLPGADPAFARWARLIPELHPAGFSEALFWTGGLPFILLAVLLGWVVGRSGPRQRGGVALLAVLVLLTTLAFLQRRWAPYAAAFATLLVPVAVSAFANFTRSWDPVPRWLLKPAPLLMVIWPLLIAWDTMLFEEEIVSRRRMEVAEQIDSALVGQWLREATLGDDPAAEQRGILCAYWLAPRLAWWSHLPAVGGVSHQSLPGILDSTRFFAETAWPEALKLAEKRQVRWIVADAPERLRETGEILLGEPLPNGSVGDQTGVGKELGLPGSVQKAGFVPSLNWYEIRPPTN